MPASGDGATAGASRPVAPVREPLDVAFPLRFDRKAACAPGIGMAVHLARQLAILGGASDAKLHCYNLSDGVERSVVGRGRGAGDMQFNWGCGGVCVTPRGTLLVADFYNHRVPEVDLDLSDRFVRVFGQCDGAPDIRFPRFVDCNEVHVAVTADGCNMVCVLSYADGSLTARIGDTGPRTLSRPEGVKLLADGSGIVLADQQRDRVVLLSLACDVLGSVLLSDQSPVNVKDPVAIVQCVAPDGDVAVILACRGAALSFTRLMKISFRSGVLESVDMPGSKDGQFSGLYGFALLPGGGLVALDRDACRFQVFTSAALRMRWVGLAVCWQGRA